MSKTDETTGPEVQNPPGRILVWTDDIRARVQAILASSIYESIDIKMIDLGGTDSPAQFQFRRQRTGLRKLEQSIEKLGVLDDITLKLIIDEDGVRRYVVVDGHTRTKILKSLMKKDSTFPIPNFRILPADCSNADAALVAVELNRYQENFDEEDQNASIIRLFEENDFTQKEIAAYFEKSTQRISEIIGAFTKVPKEARVLIEQRKWTIKKGEALARLHKYPEAQSRIMENAIKTGYNAAELENKVDIEFAKMKAKKLAKKVLESNPPEGEVVADDKKTITRGQFEKIHNDVVAKITRQRTKAYGDTKHVVESGSGEYEPGPMLTRGLLKDMDYTIVAGDAPKTKTEKKERPKMPTPKELMGEVHRSKVCDHCGGRVHDVVAEVIGFDVQQGNHAYCAIIHHIKHLQRRLEKDSITRMLAKDPKLTLKKLNDQAHQIYKDELERRKQAWKDENLPKPEKTKKKGPKAGEVVDDKKLLTQLQLLEKVRKKNPKMSNVHPVHYDFYEKYLKKESGYATMNDVVDRMKEQRMSGASKGSVVRAFKALKGAVAKEAVSA